MEFTKNKFKKEEVELLIQKMNVHYGEKLSECTSLINDLKEENRKLRFELESYKKEKDILNSSVRFATKKTKEVTSLVDRNYQAEILSLTDFHQKWSDYFNYLYEKYPLYQEVKKLKEFNVAIDDILAEDISNKQKVSKINKVLEKSGKFSPKKAIDEYVAVSGDNGFNLDEVLNPGELKLEDLCKELGLMEK